MASTGFRGSEMKTSLSQQSLQKQRGQSGASKSLKAPRSHTGAKSSQDIQSAKRRNDAINRANGYESTYNQAKMAQKRSSNYSRSRGSPGTSVQNKSQPRHQRTGSRSVSRGAIVDVQRGNMEIYDQSINQRHEEQMQDDVQAAPRIGQVRLHQKLNTQKHPRAPSKPRVNSSSGEPAAA